MAIIRAGIVLLAAANEAFIEDLFHEASAEVFPEMSDDDRKDFFKNTTKRLNTANVHNTEMLFFNLGMPWVLKNISWRGFSNKEFKKAFNKLIEVRGSIAHGRPQPVRLQSLRRWKNMVQIFAVRFEAKIALSIADQTGQHPGW